GAQHRMVARRKRDPPSSSVLSPPSCRARPPQTARAGHRWSAAGGVRRASAVPPAAWNFPPPFAQRQPDFPPPLASKRRSDFPPPLEGDGQGGGSAHPLQTAAACF